MDDHEAQRIARAHEEVGFTRVSRRVAVALTLFFLAVLALPPLLHHLGPGLPSVIPSDASSKTEPFTTFGLNLAAIFRTPSTSPTSTTADNWLTKNRAVQRELRRLEDEVEREFWLSRALRPHVQAMLLVLGQGNVEAVIGRSALSHSTRKRTQQSNWLYFQPDLRYVTGPGFLDETTLAARRQSGESWQTPAEPDPRPALLQLHRELAERGVQLVLLPTPVKPMLHPEGLVAGLESSVTALQNPSWDVFLQDLQEAGIEVLLPWQHAASTGQLVRQPQVSSLRTDTHWTPSSVESVAEYLALTLKKHLSDTSEHSSIARSTERTVDHLYRRGAAQTHTGLGDIARMLRLAEAQPNLAPETVEIRPVSTLDGSPWKSSADAPVLLLGDSFTNVYSQEELGWGSGAGLAEQLSFALQLPVQRIAVNDGSDLAVRQRLAELSTERFETLDVVVYQFALRELTSGDWRPIALPPRSTSTTPRQESGPDEPAPNGPVPTKPARSQARESVQEPVQEPLTEEPEARPSDPGTLRVRAVLHAMPELPDPREIPYRDGIVGLVLRELTVRERGVQGAPDLGEEILLYAWWLSDGRTTSVASWVEGRQLEVELVPWNEVAGDLDGYQRVEPDDPQAFLLDVYWAKTLGPG